MKQTMVFHPTHSRLDGFLFCVRIAAHALVSLSLLPFLSVAQDDPTERSWSKPVSCLVFSHTAYFLPETNLSFRGENPIFVDVQSSGETHVTIQLNVVETVQLDVSNEGTIARAYGAMESLVMLGMKLRLFESDDGRTGVAAQLRTSFDRGSADSWPYAMSSIAGNLADKGLERYSCEYHFASGAILFSHALDNTVSLHGGLEIQDINVFDSRLVFTPPATGKTTDVVRAVTRQSGLNGFFGIVVNATRHLAVLGELQSLPELAPSDNLTVVETRRAWRSAAGIRYTVRNSLTVSANAAHVFLPLGHSFTEVRVGAEATITLQ
jgi:hypothetical protein